MSHGSRNTQHAAHDSLHASRASAQHPGGAPRVALVHDWLNQIGGAENVLKTPC